MKKMMLAVVLLVGAIQGAEKRDGEMVSVEVGQEKGFYLTSGIAPSIELNPEVATWYFGTENGSYSIIGGTQRDLSNVKLYLSYQHELYNLKRIDLAPGGYEEIRRQYSNRWSSIFLQSQLNQRELLFLTGQVFLLFPKESSSVVLQNLWTKEIENSELTFDIMLGCFRSQGLSTERCVALYDACAKTLALESSDKLISDAIARSSLNRSEKSDDLRPIAKQDTKEIDVFHKLSAEKDPLNISDQDNSKKQPDDRITQVISRVSKFWEQRSFFQKCAAGSLISLLAIFALHKVFQRG